MRPSGARQSFCAGRSWSPSSTACWISSATFFSSITSRGCIHGYSPSTTNVAEALRRTARTRSEFSTRATTRRPSARASSLSTIAIATSGSRRRSSMAGTSTRQRPSWTRIPGSLRRPCARSTIGCASSAPIGATSLAPWTKAIDRDRLLLLATGPAAASSRRRGRCRGPRRPLRPLPARPCACEAGRRRAPRGAGRAQPFLPVRAVGGARATTPVAPGSRSGEDRRSLGGRRPRCHPRGGGDRRRVPTRGRGRLPRRRDDWRGRGGGAWRRVGRGDRARPGDAVPPALVYMGRRGGGRAAFRTLSRSRPASGSRSARRRTPDDVAPRCPRCRYGDRKAVPRRGDRRWNLRARVVETLAAGFDRVDPGRAHVPAESVRQEVTQLPEALVDQVYETAT